MSAPGWYPDPHDPSAIRYWDGNTWTPHVRVAALQPQQHPPESTSSHASSIEMQAQTVIELQREVARLSEEINRLRVERDTLQHEVIETNDLVLLQEIGIYDYFHPLNDSVAYRERLDQLEQAIRDVARSGRAVSGTNKWAVNGSAKDGAKMVADFQKLMLRTYNNEADNAVRTLRPYSLKSAIERLVKVRATIKKLGAIMKVEISEEYHGLRVEELELTADYAAKLAEEKEQERDERARLKEEQAAQREYEREQGRLVKEKTHYETVIAALAAKGDSEALAQAEANLTQVSKALEGVIERAANTRAGYVYIISNLGAFGERVVKIGLTRRLDPMERVRELGDASVPFRFDVHAIFFSDDAVGIEGALHQKFAHARVNLVNAHREFFYVKPEDVREALHELKGDLLSFASAPEALEWHQSENIRSGHVG